MSGPRRILFIRRDNIGDLVLTTPLIHAVRRRFQSAWIGVLGNSYNTPVLAGHPDVDEVFAYDKAKHQPRRSRWAVYLDTARLLWGLRSRRIDLVILAGPGPQPHAARLAAWVRPHAILGFVGNGKPREVTLPVPYGEGASLHEAEDVYRLGGVFGLDPPAGPSVIAPDAAEAARVRDALAPVTHSGAPVVGIHISARRQLQRWPTENFAALIRGLCLRHGLKILLLWAPGSADDPRHPGDDEKAAAILANVGPLPDCIPWPTASLAQLSGALAACQLTVCADGGAMHMAAGLGVPVVALFGDSPVRRWRPWGVRHEILQAEGGNVAAITVDDVTSACVRLIG